MKNKFLLCTRIIKQSTKTLFLLAGVALIPAKPLWASAVLDRQYKFETIGVLKPYDNSDDLFATYAAEGFDQYFTHQFRFIFKNISKVDDIFKYSKFPYQTAIEDPQILSALEKGAKVESLIRTKIIRQINKYHVRMDWLRLTEQVATHEFDFEGASENEPFDQGALTEMFEKALEKLIAEVPFKGQVTGVDIPQSNALPGNPAKKIEGKTITTDTGTFAGVSKGDTLQIGTLEVIRKHPLLKTIVGWKLIPTGEAVVQDVDDGMAFSKVTSEEPGKEIGRYQKVVKIIPGAGRRSGVSVQANAESPSEDSNEPDSELHNPNTPPRFGWVGAGINLGSYSRDTNDGTTQRNGSASLKGGNIESQVWLTKEWFAEAELGYSYFNLDQTDLTLGGQTPVSANGGVSGSITRFRLDVGYTYLLNHEFFGPKAWGKLGYKTTSFGLPDSVSEFTGSLSVSNIFLGVGVDLPFKDRFGIQGNVNYRLIGFASAPVISADARGVSELEFFLAGYYRLRTRLTLRFGFGLQANSVDFENNTSISQKAMTFGPALLYYF